MGGWSGFQGAKWPLPLCVSLPQIDQIAHTHSSWQRLSRQDKRSGNKGKWVLNEEEKDSCEGGGGKGRGFSAYLPCLPLFLCPPGLGKDGDCDA